MLDYDISPADDPKRGAVLILLHGRGSNRRDLMGFRPTLPASVTVVCPDAPFPGREWGYGPGWAWYRYLGEDRPEPESFHASLKAIDGLLDAIESELPDAAGRLVLGGFSQGGTIALGYALTHPDRVRRVAVFSGFLADVAGVEASDRTAEGLSVFWGHGLQDPAIPFELGSRGRQALRTAGAKVDAHDYPMGHGIVPEEIDDFTRWLDEMTVSSGPT